MKFHVITEQFFKGEMLRAEGSPLTYAAKALRQIFPVKNVASLEPRVNERHSARRLFRCPATYSTSTTLCRGRENIWTHAETMASGLPRLGDTALILMICK